LENRQKCSTHEIVRREAKVPYRKVEIPRKVKYICRKLRLHRGEHLLDIGCGWGGLILYAAAYHGVCARGITLSLRRAELARERIRDAGLDRQCRVEVCDYRDLS
jgi:cyclopropane-fatty-acyl-phospholipid synthase